MSNTVGWIALLFLLLGAASASAEDLSGSRDFDELPRVKDSRIVGYEFQEYGIGSFVIRIGDDKRAVVTDAEGERTRIVYLGQQGQSALQFYKNYETAFRGFGPFVELFSCKGKSECGVRMASQTIWAQDQRISTNFSAPNSLYTVSSYRDPMYLYGTVQKDDKLFHLAVFVAHLIKGQTGVQDMPIVHLEVVEIKEFEPELVFVSADEMASTIESLGAIALYGIQFAFDSAELAESSAETLAEIAKVMSDNPELEIFVVGHTDNAGKYTYNLELATRRAESVVASLVAEHSVAANRLVAVGVGPVAPKSSNSTEEGRALNRRVEIVQK